MIPHGIHQQPCDMQRMTVSHLRTALEALDYLAMASLTEGGDWENRDAEIDRAMKGISSEITRRERREGQ